MLWMIYLQKYVLNETKSVHFTVFNMIARINEARTLIHVLVNANSITQDVIQIKKKIMKHVNVSIKIIEREKMNPSMLFVRTVST